MIQGLWLKGNALYWPMPLQNQMLFRWTVLYGVYPGAIALF